MATRNKAPVAGSNTEPATLKDIAVEVTELNVSGNFPREVELVNETASQYVIAGKFVGASETVRVLVGSDDEITRMRTDCAQIMALNELYADLEVPALRIIEVAE